MKNCEYCKKEFEPRRDAPGRFCSSLCNRKVLRRDQIKKRKEFLERETPEERIARLQTRYEKHVLKNENSCWSWRSTLSSGYGVMMFDGAPQKAHRVSWIIHNGDIPKGLFVLHTCDNRICSRPDHLFLGTNADNMRDMASKGRTGTRLGSKNSASVLQENQVRRIKQLLSLGVPVSRIARDYQVNVNTIRSIKSGKTWGWLK